MNELIELFFTFMKIGFFTFGGGYAMIPLIEDICVKKEHWITHDEMMNMTVIAEATPGPIAINCATFVGYKKAKLTGAVVATLGVILPSFIVIYGISVFLDSFLEITVIAHAFKGLKIAVGVLILNAAVTMIQRMPKNVLSGAIMTGSFVVMLLINIFAWNFSTIGLLLVAAAIRMAVFFIKEIEEQRGGKKK